MRYGEIFTNHARNTRKSFSVVLCYINLQRIPGHSQCNYGGWSKDRRDVGLLSAKTYMSSVRMDIVEGLAGLKLAP